MKYVLCVLLLIGIVLLPGVAWTEDVDTMHLARVLYTLARNESEETAYMIGTVILNRLSNPWYPDTLAEVLEQTHQFACGTRYDERALRLSRELLAGRRELAANVLSVYALDSSALPTQEPCTISGNYAFYGA